MYLNKIILAIIGLLMAGGSCLAAEEELDYELNLGSFSKLKVINSVNVVYTASTDSAGTGVFRAPKRLADLFIVSNNGGTLRVETLPQATPERDLPTLYLYSEFLSEAENDADSTLTIKSVAPCPRFKAVQMGNGRLIIYNLKCTDAEAQLLTGNGAIILSGQCTNAKYRMVGTGIIQADDLTADYVKCGILGGGTIGCWPRFELNVRGIGSTKIYYKGNPEVKKRGGGKLFRLDTYNESDYETAEEESGQGA